MTAVESNSADPIARESLDDVVSSVYAELHAIARRTMHGASADLTLQPTALVSEAYIRLSMHRNGWDDRRNFMVAASIAMRRALIDHIRQRSAGRRDTRRRSDIDVESISIDGRAISILEVEDELRRLERDDPELATIVELMVYGGMTTGEIADLLNLGLRTVQRRIRFARAWLARAMA